VTTELARLQHFGRCWFASVMGTGIVATAGATLPVHVPGLHVFAPAAAGPVKAKKDPTPNA
jgi:tellurite resistance protein TehA-like permease